MSKHDQTTVDFHPTEQLTKAVARRGEIRFELHVPEGKDDPRYVSEWAQGLASDFNRAMASADTNKQHVNVLVDKQDTSKVTVVYETHDKNLEERDRQAIISMFAEVGVLINERVIRALGETFGAFRELNKPEQGSAASAELARRSAAKAHGGRVSG